MNQIYKSVLFLIFLALSQNILAQRIFYSLPDRDDSRQMKFEILGKYNGKYLIYKNNRNRHSVIIYNPDMQVKEKIDLDFVPERLINMDVFSNQESSVLIYQYQRKNVVYCMGVRIDGNGKKIGEPLQLDTTELPTFSDNKIYSVITSDDKQKLMVFKMRNRSRDEFEFQTLLLSNNLIPIRRAQFKYNLENNRDAIADFYLDNDGNFLFTHVSRQAQREYITNAKLCLWQTYADSLKIYPVNLKELSLDELRIKVDNTNGRYILSSFYSKSKRGNIDGLYTTVISKDFQQPDLERTYEFSDELRNAAKGESSTRMAFNDYYLKNYIINKDGGILITAESAYTNNRGGNFNRWDNPWLWGSPMGFNNFYGWSPFNNWGWGGMNGPWGWNNFGGMGGQQVRYYTDNVLVLAIDKQGKIDWTNVLTKSQFDETTDNLLSYQLMNSGSELLFLYNEWSRRQPMLSAYSIDPSGKLNKEPPLRSLDKGYEFMIRLGKQVSAREMIVPAVYRNSLSFTRIEF
jgi:hypothetical protein